MGGMGMRVIMGGFRGWGVWKRGVWKRRRVGGVGWFGVGWFEGFGGFEGFGDEGVAGWVVH